MLYKLNLYRLCLLCAYLLPVYASSNQQKQQEQQDRSFQDRGGSQPPAPKKKFNSDGKQLDWTSMHVTIAAGRVFR